MKLRAVVEGSLLSLIFTYLFGVLEVDPFPATAAYLDPVVFTMIVPPVVAGFWITFRGGAACFIYSVIIPPVPLLMLLLYSYHSISPAEIALTGGWERQIANSVLVVVFASMLGLLSGQIAESLNQWRSRKHLKEENRGRDCYKGSLTAEGASAHPMG